MTRAHVLEIYNFKKQRETYYDEENKVKPKDISISFPIDGAGWLKNQEATLIVVVVLHTHCGLATQTLMARHRLVVVV